jgi:hypothetical protein
VRKGGSSETAVKEEAVRPVDSQRFQTGDCQQMIGVLEHGSGDEGEDHI